MFTSQDFESEVNNLSLKPGILVRCQDQWVGNVLWKDVGFEYKDKGDANFAYRKNLTEISSKLPSYRLIIVLESPHTDEFNLCKNSHVQNFIGPANGKTGEHIRKYLDLPTREFSSVKFVKPNDKYALILMNAVPYQCSLGKSLSGSQNKGARKVRDMVFRVCWEKAKHDFVERLSRYLTVHTLVINACTKGESKGGRGGRWLREMVETSILACNVPSDCHVRRCHPSSLPNWKAGTPWVHRKSAESNS